MKFFLLFLSFLTLAACAAGNDDYRIYFAERHIPQPGLEAFPHCHGYGCKTIDSVALSKAQWKKIGKIFNPKPKTPEKERQRIARAIGVFETEIGAMTGTQEDVRGTFRKVGTLQHDCVDESTNTTTYLSLLEEKGLLRFHDVKAPMARLPLVDYMGRWPHQTAVIAEKESGARFAVDSWFHDNGEPAEIVPLNEWKSGWKPESSHDSFL